MKMTSNKCPPPPNFLFVKSVHEKGFIHGLDVLHDGQAVFFCDDRLLVLVFLDERIRIHADHQIVTALLRMVQEVQVTDVEHIVNALRIANVIMFFH